MLKIRLDGKLTCATDCPFGRFDYERERTMCMFDLFQSECRAENIKTYNNTSIEHHEFNIDDCEYISKEN